MILTKKVTSTNNKCPASLVVTSVALHLYNTVGIRFKKAFAKVWLIVYKISTCKSQVQVTSRQSPENIEKAH